MNRRRALRLGLTILFYVALVVFLVVYLSTLDFGALADVEPALVWLIPAAVLALGFRYWQAFIWITLLRGLGARDVRMSPQLVEVYAKSWLGRYIPGTAPWILGKIFFASQRGISKARLAVGSLLEAAIQIAVLLALSSLVLLFDPRLDVLGPGLRVTLILALVACIVGLLPPVFNFGMSLVFRVVRRKELAADNRATAATIAVAAGQYVIGAVLAGASLFFLAKTVYPALAFGDFLYVMSASNLASAASMLAVFAPGGIGVREGVQLALLAVVIPGAVALVVVVATRIWALVMDLLFFASGELVAFLARRRGGSAGEPVAAPESPED